MTRAGWNPNAPGALGLEPLGVGTTGFSTPALGMTQHALRFTAQRSGEVDEVAVYCGALTNVPLMTPGALFAGHRVPYFVELIPVASLDADPPHTITPIPSQISTSNNLTHYPGGGGPQVNDLGSDDTVGVNANSSAGQATLVFPNAATFPLNVQVISLAVEWVAFSTNLRISRGGDGNILGNPALWTRVFTGGNSNFHLGEAWVESGDTALWHEVTPLMIRQFASAVGNRRLIFDVELFSAGFAYNMVRFHVDSIPERRLGVGILEVASGVANQVNRWVRVPLHAPGATGSVPSVVAGQEYYLVIRNGYGESEFGLSSNLDVRTVSDQMVVVPVHFESLDWDFFPVTLSQSLPTGAVGALRDGLPAIRLINNGVDTVDSQPYERTVGGRAYVGKELRQNQIPNASPSTEYRSLRLNLSIAEEPDDELIVTMAPNVTGAPFAGPFVITPEQVEALPGGLNNLDEFGNEYKPVTIDFGQGIQFPNPFDIVLQSSAGSFSPWLAAVMQSTDLLTGDETFASFATGEAVDPKTGTVKQLNVTGDGGTNDDLQFVLFTQAPEVTGLDVTVLSATGHGATCDKVTVMPEQVSESFNQPDSETLGPDLDWKREVFDFHSVAMEVFKQRGRWFPALETMSLSGAAVSQAETSDKAQLDIVGDLVIDAEISAADWTPAAMSTIASKWTTTGDQRSWLFQLNTSGQLRTIHSPDGTVGAQIINTCPVALTPPADRSRVAVRAAIDVDNGAGGHTVRFYTANKFEDGFTFLAQVTTGGTTSIFSGTAPLRVGGFNTTSTEPFIGYVDRVRVYAGLAATDLRADPSFKDQAVGDTLFDDTVGNTWSLAANADIILVTDSPIAPGTYEDLQFPQPTITSPDVRAELDFVNVVDPALSSDWLIDIGFVMRAQLLEDGADYRGYAIAVGRSNGVFNPATVWHLIIFKVNGRASVTVLDADIASTVTAPGHLSVEVEGTRIAATFTHSSGSTDPLHVEAFDDEFQDGLTGLGASFQINEAGDTANLDFDNFVLEPIVQACGDCARPEITYPRVCWAPSELGVDFAGYELQRRDGAGEPKTVQFITAQDPSVTAIGAFDHEDDTNETSVVAPSVIAEGNELLFCHWHSIGAPTTWNATGTGTNPLGTTLSIPAVTGGPFGFLTPNRPEFEVTDLDVRCLVQLADWTPGAALDSQSLVGQGQLPNNVSWGFVVLATGSLTFLYSTDGTALNLRLSTVGTGFAANDLRWVRFTLDADDGAGNHVVKFYTSLDGFTWTQLGATVTTAGAVNLFNSTAPIVVGTPAGTASLTSTLIRYVEVRNQIDGPVSSVIAQPDFHTLLPGTTAFDDDCNESIAVANHWTVTGAGVAVIADNEQENTGSGRSSSIAGWQQVSAGATGPRTATISPAQTWSAMSVLVRGADGGPPVMEQVSSRTAFNGDSVSCSIFAKRGQWLLALFGTGAGDTATIPPPSPHSGVWTTIVDSGDTNQLSERMLAWIRPVINDGEQLVLIPQTAGAGAPWDYHLRVVALSNVAEFLSTCYDDWAVPYNQLACYRIRQFRTDGSISDWSPEVCTTVAPPAGVDLIITAPDQPELNAAYNEAHTRLPTTRPYTLLDASQVVHQAVYGRDKQLAFRPLERLGVAFSRTLLVSPLCQNPVPCLDAVKPLADLMVAQVEVLVVRDTCGNAWFASLNVPTVTQFSSPEMPDLWTADIDVVELAAPIVNTIATEV